MKNREVQSNNRQNDKISFGYVFHLENVRLDVFRFGLNNIRRIKETGLLQIKPITILVGRNSSGKSSFLRSIPLLKQSIMTKTNGPILWFGEWVDFGTFKESVKKNESEITFSFSFDDIKIKRDYFLQPLWTSFFEQRHLFDVFGINVPSDKIEGVDIHISIKNEDEITYINHIKLFNKESKSNFDAYISSDGRIDRLNINDSDVSSMLGDWNFSVEQNNIFPKIKLTPKKNAFDPEKISKEEMERKIKKNPIQDSIEKIFRNYFNSGSSKDSIEKFSKRIMLLNNLDISNIEDVFDEMTPKKIWKKIQIDFFNENARNQEELNKLILLSIFPRLVNSCAENLNSIFESVLYIGPARSKSNRYYRYQDLSVSEIDPNGDNFPMFLNSLSPSQLKSFSEWVRKLFGYGISLKKESGHIAINLIYGDNKINIVDTGYGVSQLLPVLGQVWWANNKPRENTNIKKSEVENFRILAIEQPELHLHPAHQALLADSFAGAVNSFKSSDGRITKYVIETHSEAFINRIGEMISEKKLSFDDVSVLVFDQLGNDEETTEIHISNFSEDGYLENWPYNFFVPVSV